MKQGKIVKAMKVLNKLAAKELPVKAAFTIHRLRTLFEPTWKFQLEEEEKILHRLQPEVTEAGNAMFKTPEDANEFRQWRKEMDEMDVDVDPLLVKPVSLSMALFDGVTLCAEDIDALEGILSFTED